MGKQIAVDTAVSCVDAFMHQWCQRMGDEPIFVTVRLMRYADEGGAFSNVREVAKDRKTLAAEMRKSAAHLLNQADWLDSEGMRDG